MNKTISINLGGIFFHIEEEAYYQLDHYLKSIGQHFSAEEGAGEIVEDIEARIAEMFDEKLKGSRRQVVLSEDVQGMITIMGYPEQFDDDSAASTGSTIGTNAGVGEDIFVEHQQKPGKGKGYNRHKGNAGSEEDQNFRERRNEHRANRRFYRNPDDKIISGVCSGLSAYFGITDPIWMRLLFIGLLITGIGIPIVPLYIVLAIIVPKAKTVGQKLAMQGEPINLSSMEKGLKDEMGNVKKKFEEISQSKAGKNTRNLFGSIGNSFERNRISIIRVVSRIIALAAVGFGLLVLLSLIMSALGVALGVIASIKFMVNYIFTSVIPIVVATISALLMLFIPILLVSYLVSKKTFNLKPRRTRWGRVMALVWVVSLVAFLFSSSRGAAYFSEEDMVKQSTVIPNTGFNTVFIDFLKDDNNSFEEQQAINRSGMPFGFPFEDINDAITENREGKLLIKNVWLDIEQASGNEFELLERRSARGTSLSDARTWAKNIDYTYEVQDSVLRFSDFLSTAKADKWRKQELHLTLKVPIGKSVYLAKNSEKVIYDIENVTNTLDRKMLGKTWIMTQEGLAKLNADMSINDGKNKSSKVALNSEKSSAVKNTLSTNGNINGKEKYYDFENFSRINLAGNVKATIEQGDDFAVSMIGTDGNLAMVDIDQRGKTLKIKYLGSDYSNEKGEKIKATIVLPYLSELSLSGNTIGSITDYEKNGRMVLNLSGNAKCFAKMDIDKLEIELSGNAKANLVGSADEIESELSGNAKIDASNFSAEKIRIEGSGLAKAEVNVSDNLEADLSGLSKVSYSGTAKVKAETSGGAHVVKMD